MLGHTGGNKREAAERLGISYKAILYKIREFGIGRPRAATEAGGEGDDRDGGGAAAGDVDGRRWRPDRGDRGRRVGRVSGELTLRNTPSATCLNPFSRSRSHSPLPRFRHPLPTQLVRGTLLRARVTGNREGERGDGRGKAGQNGIYGLSASKGKRRSPIRDRRHRRQIDRLDLRRRLRRPVAIDQLPLRRSLPLSSAVGAARISTTPITHKPIAAAAGSAAGSTKRAPSARPNAAPPNSETHKTIDFHMAPMTSRPAEHSKRRATTRRAVASTTARDRVYVPALPRTSFSSSTANDCRAASAPRCASSRNPANRCSLYERRPARRPWHADCFGTRRINTQPWERATMMKTIGLALAALGFAAGCAHETTPPPNAADGRVSHRQGGRRRRRSVEGPDAVGQGAGAAGRQDLAADDRRHHRRRPHRQGAAEGDHHQAARRW